jgi:hypothetical protein
MQIFDAEVVDRRFAHFCWINSNRATQTEGIKVKNARKLPTFSLQGEFEIQTKSHRGYTNKLPTRGAGLSRVELILAFSLS